MIQNNIPDPEVLTPEWTLPFEIVKYPSLNSSITQ
jgi:hypothetical protein